MLGVLEIRAGAGLGGLGCFWDGVVIESDFEAGDQLVIKMSSSTTVRWLILETLQYSYRSTFRISRLAEAPRSLKSLPNDSGLRLAFELVKN